MASLCIRASSKQQYDGCTQRVRSVAHGETRLASEV